MYEELERDILKGKYKANEKLPGVHHLAKKFKVSYGTAHAAISKLAEARLVIIEHGRGTYVLGKQPVGIEWLWFTGGHSIYDELLDLSFDFIKYFWRGGESEKVTLNLNFFDVRNLPSPKTLAKVSRERGIRGLLVCGHGKHFLDYVNEVSKHIPLVSLFGYWQGDNFNYIAPDIFSLVDDFFGDWKKQGANEVGLISLPLENNPNYLKLFNAMEKCADKHNIAFFRQNCFFGSDYDDATNWILGRLNRPNSPKFWVASVPGHAKAIKKAAEIAGLSLINDIDVLTFSMLESDYENLGGCIHLGVQQFDLTVKTGLDILMKMIWNPRTDIADEDLCIPCKVLRAIKK